MHAHLQFSQIALSGERFNGQSLLIPTHETEAHLHELPIGKYLPPGTKI